VAGVMILAEQIGLRQPGDRDGAGLR
jgi:hypothetical protein